MHEAARSVRSQPMQLERYVKKHIVRIGTARVRRSGDIYMTARQEYLLKAAELSAMAQVETDHADRLEFENLARSYLRLAEQAFQSEALSGSCGLQSVPPRSS